jgi:hypothetical protein
VNLRAALRQPLLYFVLVGAAVFLVDAWLRRNNDVVDVNDGVRREVAAEFATQNGHPPNPDELQRALDTWVTTEVLFREASKLGLEANDAVIRAHLANKLALLERERIIVAPASDDELRAQLDAHPERYTKPNTFKLTHVFVNRGTAPESFEARAAEVGTKLNEGAEPSTLGDHFPRGPVFEGMTQAQLQSVLNLDLSTALEPARVGTWQRLAGPRGAHFIRLDGIVSGKPTFESVRAVLVADVDAQKRDAAVQQFVEALKKQYIVRTLGAELGAKQ